MQNESLYLINLIREGIETEKYIRLNKIIIESNIVLGDKQSFIWLFSKNNELNNQSPISFLDTAAGYNLVVDNLMAIPNDIILA